VKEGGERVDIVGLKRGIDVTVKLLEARQHGTQISINVTGAPTESRRSLGTPNCPEIREHHWVIEKPVREKLFDRRIV
jgi:hypothetical protein